MNRLNVADFFRRSIRNKLILSLSSILVFVQMVAFTLCTLSLRDQLQRYDWAFGAEAVIRNLLLTQTATLVTIAVIIVLATIATVSIVTHLISEPIKQLTDEAPRVTESDDLQLSEALSQRGDEVGSIARHMNELLSTVRQQTQTIAQTASNVAQGEMARRVAHDIQSPLTSLRVASQHLHRLLPSSEDGDIALQILDLGHKRLSEISKALLDRPATTIKETFAWFALDELCDELVREFRMQPLGEGIEFVTDHQVAALAMSGNRTGLQRAVGNLMKNALEALQTVSADRPRRLAVSSRVIGNLIRLEIADTGPGIPAHILPKILQGGHTHGKKDGHGIGMQVIREVVTTHGGTLDCNSSPESGTIFRIDLPYQQQAA